MANRYSQTFTLKDIFNNKKLRNKLPLINYREKTLENGKLQRRTNAKTVNRQIFDTAEKTARPFYKPLISVRSGDTLILDGNLEGNQDDVVEAVYNSLVSIRSLLIWTANNADMIRSALKESEKNKRIHGIDTKLYLRAKSMQEIEGMSRPQLQALLGDIMDNLFYSDDFPETQKKYNVKDLPAKSNLDFNRRQEDWKRKVGDE